MAYSRQCPIIYLDGLTKVLKTSEEPVSGPRFFFIVDCIIVIIRIESLLILLFLLLCENSNQTFVLFFQLAQLLPMEENFLLLFRFDNPLESSVEFMKVSLCEADCVPQRLTFVMWLIMILGGLLFGR